MTAAMTFYSAVLISVIFVGLVFVALGVADLRASRRRGRRP